MEEKLKKAEDIDVVNTFVSEAKRKAQSTEEKNKKLLDYIKKNQDKFYHLDRIEIGMKSFMREDEVVFKYIQTHLGEGMLRAILEKAIPDLKKELKEIISRHRKLEGFQ